MGGGVCRDAYCSKDTTCDQHKDAKISEFPMSSWQ